LTLSLTEFTAWMHRETPHNLVSDFSVRIMGSSSQPVWIFVFSGAEEAATLALELLVFLFDSALLNFPPCWCGG
ncbi:hypothetical protein ACQX1X_00005, partial [Corynebacterium diphtheriae]